MGKWVHRLTEIDKIGRTAVCANCGPVSVKPKGQRQIWRCGKAIQQRKGSNGDRFAQSLRRYGLDRERFGLLLIAQSGRCAICQDGLSGDFGKGLNIDHDHECCPGKTSCGLCIRGLLCARCNRGLGCFRDDTALLTSAGKYLNEEPPL